MNRSTGLLVLALALVSLPMLASRPISGDVDDRDQIAALLDRFHDAASRTDLETYIGCMSAGAVFLGTDAGERWTRTEFEAFCRTYFEQGIGWTYTPASRSIDIAGDIAWFDEVLDNEKYGQCRGTGVLQRTISGWRISQYSLTLLVPNERATAVVETIRGGVAPPVTVYIVRHAEKIGTPGDPDPDLTDEGTARAALLDQMLADLDVQVVTASRFQRTQLTVESIAARHEVEVQAFDPRQPLDTVAAIRTVTPGGVAVVAGHSNTVPWILRALRVEEDITIDESEYDNLFVVTIQSNGAVSMQRLRFGSGS